MFGSFGRIAARFTGGTLAAAGLTTGICGVYGASQINISRPRWFTDDFVLTPETLRMPYKQVSFTSEDGVQLSGWLIEQTVRGKPSKRWVMCCNPYMHDKSTLLGVARGMWDAGYTVLLFDFRSHAPNPVKRETIGYLERLDGLAALRWLHEHKPKDSLVGLVGASMGGAVALTLSGTSEEDTGGDLVCCATDCAFYNLKDVIANRLHQQHPTALLANFEPIKFAILEALCWVNKIWFGYDPEQVGPMNCQQNIKVPLLLLHSENDQVVPLDHVHRIFEGVATPVEEKEVVIFPEVHHIGGYFMNEKDYIQRIVGFLDKQFTRAEEGKNTVLVEGSLSSTQS